MSRVDLRRDVGSLTSGRACHSKISWFQSTSRHDIIESSSAFQSASERKMPSEDLITIYFVSYIPCAVIGSWIMDRRSLGFGVVFGGFLQAFGATLRYAACSLGPEGEAYLTLAGQTIASLAMPFMVNSPPLFSANWFPPSMRAVATNVTLNANALGTAVVYLMAPFIVLSTDDVPSWNLYVALVAVGSSVVAAFFFRSRPPSRKLNVEKEEKYEWKQWWTAFMCPGFWHTIIAFSLAECIINAWSALLDEFLGETPLTKPQIGVVGAVFIVSSLIGGQIVSQGVDKKRNHQEATLLCLFLTAISIMLFQLLSKLELQATLVSLLITGAVLGPIQPIVLELGVECAHPTSEATVAALQQLCGNFLSAIAVPLLSALQRRSLSTADQQPQHQNFYTSPEWVMVFMTIATSIVFYFYNGKYKRSAHESKIVLSRIDLDPVITVNTSTEEASFS
ncbi:unnamed protein product [Phytophthora lilii]|uniref:Unnamed protein product n=1 Tax=Phytophthora lilii TaxID=2077276 RepID=A0A9W6WEX3_9STRA|nr:unnamed protein product [Phytophthora lilii]